MVARIIKFFIWHSFLRRINSFLRLKHSTFKGFLPRLKLPIFFENPWKMIIIFFPKKFSVSATETLKMNKDMTMMTGKIFELPASK